MELRLKSKINEKKSLKIFADIKTSVYICSVKQTIKNQIIMKKVIETPSRQVFNIEVNYNFSPSGYGHYEITCTVNFDGHEFSTSTKTNDMQFIDKCNDLEEDGEFEKVQEMIDNKFFDDDFDEIVAEKILSLAEVAE